MRTFNDSSIDLVVTSPPYDNLRNYNGNIFQWSFDKFKLIAKELYRVMKTGGVVVWIVDDATKNGSETGTSFRTALQFKDIGFNLYDTMIYAKNNPIPLTHRRYEQSFEYMFVFSKGKPKTFHPIMEICTTSGKSGRFRQKSDGILMDAHKKEITKGKKIKGNIWYYSVGSMNSTTDSIAYKHPATFPEELAKDHILSWTNEEDVILDPFCGSGTTCKMAFLNNAIKLSQNLP